LPSRQYTTVPYTSRHRRRKQAFQSYSFVPPESTTQTVNQSLQPFCTAHGRKSLYLRMGAPIPQFVPSQSSRGSGPHLTHDFLGTYTSQQPKRYLDRFSRFCTDNRRVHVPQLWTPVPPSELPLPRASIWTPSNTWFLGPSSFRPNGILIASVVLAGLTSVTDRHTDQPTDIPLYSVGNNRPHLRT